MLKKVEVYSPPNKTIKRIKMLVVVTPKMDKSNTDIIIQVDYKEIDTYRYLDDREYNIKVDIENDSLKDTVEKIKYISDFIDSFYVELSSEDVQKIEELKEKHDTLFNKRKKERKGVRKYVKSKEI